MNYNYNLGDLLYSHIQKSGYSIYELSKKTNINRSMLQKILSNERKLTKKNLESLKPYLKVSPMEYAELTRMTEQIQEGTFHYQTYQMIKDLMIKVSETTNVHRDASGEYIAVASGETEEKDIYLGKTIVEKLLHEKIRQEYKRPAPQMQVYIPGGEALLCQVLSRESLISPACRSLKIRQIICFARNKSISDTAWKNVNALENVLPNIVVSKCFYEVYFYYGNEISDVKGEYGFPYYIIFSDSVLLLNTDCSAALLCKKVAVWNYFTNVFDEFMKHVEPLVTSCIKAEEILPHMMSLDCAGNPLYSLEYQPCLFANMTEDMVYKYARQTIPFYDVAIKTTISRIRQMKKLECHICYFSKDGVYQFARTGMITDLPAEYALPFDIEDRMILLKRLYEEIEANKYHHRMINPYSFPIPDSLICVLHQDVGIDLYGFGTDKRNYNYICITEASLLDIFLGFFRYLKKSMLICTKEETLECIRECIAELGENEKL